MLTLPIAARWIALVYVVVIPLVLVISFAPAAWNPLEHPKVLVGIIVGTLLVTVIGMKVNMKTEASSLAAFLRELAPEGRWEPDFRAKAACFASREAHQTTPAGRVIDWRLPGGKRSATLYLQTAAYSTRHTRTVEPQGDGYRPQREVTARLEVVIEVPVNHALPALLTTATQIDGESWQERLHNRDWHVFGQTSDAAPDAATLSSLIEWTRGTAALVNEVGAAPRGALMALPSLIAELVFANMLPGIEPALELAPDILRLRLPALLFESNGPREKNRSKLQRRLTSLAELCDRLEKPAVAD